MNKKILISIVVLSICCLIATGSLAKKYSDAPPGQGTSRVGTGGDYATLAEAAADFTATANTGNWTIEILSDTIEPPNTFMFANTIGVNTVLIKPFAGVTATLYIMQTADNPAWSGNMLIGARSTTDYYDVIKTDNIIIDGSNNGTNTRDLTFINQDTVAPNARFLRIIGDCDNITIKNCNFINRSRSSSIYGILFTSIDSSGPATADNAKVINCYINCTTGSSGTGIAISRYPTTLVLASAATGITISNNIVEGRTRGIFLDGVADCSVNDNIVRLTQYSGGYNSQGIYHYSSMGATGWTVNIYNNVLDKLYSTNTYGGSYGINGIALGVSASGTYNVYNNMLTGFELAGDANYANSIYRGIYIIAATNTCNVFNNSINMKNNSNYIGFVANNANALIISAAAAEIKNNIIRQAQLGAACMSIYTIDTVTPGILVCDYNDLYADTAGGATTGRWFGVNQLTLFDWTTVTGIDVNSQDVDPFATSPDKWVSNADLHFTGTNAVPLLPGTPITTPFAITTDIDGNPRNASTPWKGCDEAISPLSATPSSMRVKPGDPAVTIFASGGTPPYFGAVSGEIGNLSAFTNDSAIFTPTDSTAHGAITVTDSTIPTAQQFMISVDVIPTSAPLFMDVEQKKYIRFE